MSTETFNLRTQTLANAKLLLKTTTSSSAPTSPALGNTSQSTLIASSSSLGELDVVVFGTNGEYTAAVMVGLVPAIETEPTPNAETALRKLFAATCELLKMYIPKVGSHQRNIHGGGVFDEDMICPDIVEAQKKSP